MEKNKDPKWSKNPQFNEMQNLMENMNEAMNLFGQILKEKKAQLISLNNKLKEQNGRSTMGS